VGFGGLPDANMNLAEYEILIQQIVKKHMYKVVVTFRPDEIELYNEIN
jgi:hypothetical protein